MDGLRQGGDGRQLPAGLPLQLGKRPRTVPSSSDELSYHSHLNDIAGHITRDTETFHASYGRYLCQAVTENSSYGGEPGGSWAGGLPPNATNTLFVEGFPPDCILREACHIFRPFRGFREVRLVRKESKYTSGDSVVFCFIEFENPSYAARAMDALQGYQFDELARNSPLLRLQFARNPGARSGGGHRVKH